MARPHFILLVIALALHASLNPAQAQGEVQNGSVARYILTGPDMDQLKSDVERLGGSVVSRLRYHSGWVVKLADSQAAKLQQTLSLRSSMQVGVRSLEDSPQREILEKDGDVWIADPQASALIEDDPALNWKQKTPWGINAVHAPETFNRTRGESAIVCVIDTGVQKHHPDLKNNIIGGDNTITSSDPVGRKSWEDDNGHGTHVSGTIAAEDNGVGVVGVAPEAKIFAVKGLSARGSGTFSSLAEGIRSCIAHQANVINLSLAYTDESETVKNAVNDALREGIILVAAAGNSHGPVEYPARFPGVIAVSSLATTMKISYFSNRGPEIAFAAPGEKILSTYLGNKYAVLQGTSQATPHVAGVAALLYSSTANHSLHATPKLRARDLGLASQDQGAGCIDALETLTHGLSVSEIHNSAAG